MQNVLAKRERESIGEAVAVLSDLALIDRASRARRVTHSLFMQYLLDPLPRESPRSRPYITTHGLALPKHNSGLASQTRPSSVYRSVKLYKLIGARKRGFECAGRHRKPRTVDVWSGKRADPNPLALTPEVDLGTCAPINVSFELTSNLQFLS